VTGTALPAPVETSPEELVAQAQSGDIAALELLFERFRPLLRSRMQLLWTNLREELNSLEWGDVEAQINLMFLNRVEAYQAPRGVYFAHYIERMLSLDCKVWLRAQRRSAAVPFSQLSTDSEDAENWIASEASSASDIENAVSVRAALELLTAPQREAVWQVCILGRTEEETATQLGVSRSAIRNRLESGLVRLRAFFEREQAMPETRTGRRTSTLAVLDHWTERILMAKDEKRPDLVGIGAGRPITLQGVFEFERTGLKTPQLLSVKLRYVVPPGHVLGIRYFRAGVVCDQMTCLSTVVNGMPHRLIPIAANDSIHVPFAIVEPICAGSEIEIHIASEAPGTAIIDVGCLQMPA
jgi:RNA polymerase sigma factor (sigma-70 family)